MLEAERQKIVHNRYDDWAVELSKLVEDDAFATFVQVIFFFFDKLGILKGKKNKNRYFGCAVDYLLRIHQEVT